MSAQQTAELPETCAIGIAFGNSNSSIAYTTSDGKTEVIANEEGDRYIPSMLSYIQGEEYHGTQAKAQLVRNSGNTVGFFKEFLGRQFSEIDPSQCQASAHPQAHNNSIAFSICDTTTTAASTAASTATTPSGSTDNLTVDAPHPVTVAEITTRHLNRLVSSASDFLGRKVTAAVISIPTNWKDSQKEALLSAAKAANLHILQLIHDPTAALLAYDARPEATASDAVRKDRIVLVADFGGTRSDVAVIAARSGIYTILASKTGYDLGGAQLDTVLIDHFAKEFIRKNGGAGKVSDPRDNPRGLAKLKLEAEATKRALSLGANAALSVESLADGIDYTSTVNRSRYELLAAKIFASMAALVREAVDAAHLDVLDIDEVILSGGTSHTPRLATNTQLLFPHSTILAPATHTTAIDPSSLGARGAAIQASLIADFEQSDIEACVHPVVTLSPHLTHTLGLMTVSADTSRGVFLPLIHKDTALPCKRTVCVPVSKSGGDVLVKVCQAERVIRVIPVAAKTEALLTKRDAQAEGSSDEEEEEEEPKREKTWTVSEDLLAEVAVLGVRAAALTDAAATETKKKAKAKKEEKVEVEVTVHVAADRTLTVTAREIGGKAVARGVVAGIAV